MANDRLIFEVVAEGKNLKVVQRDVNALAEGVERTDRARKNAGKGQDNYNKREKALYQGNLSSAKSFSKMNQTDHFFVSNFRMILNTPNFTISYLKICSHNFIN